MEIQPGLLGKYDLQEQLGRGGMSEGGVLATLHIRSQKRQFSRPNFADAITRVFPPVSQVPSALCPGVTGFHRL